MELLEENDSDILVLTEHPLIKLKGFLMYDNLIIFELDSKESSRYLYGNFEIESRIFQMNIFTVFDWTNRRTLTI